MATKARRISLAAFALGLAASALGCGSTEPVASKHTLVGTWEITTQLARYNAPDTALTCSSTSCLHMLVTPSPGASLRGTLVITDSVLFSGDTVRFPVTIPTMIEADCGVEPSCASRVVPYFPAGMLFVNEAQPRWAEHVTNSADVLQGEVLRLAYGRFSGDSISGTVAWFPSNGYDFRSYTGTFVAHRKR